MIAVVAGHPAIDRLYEVDSLSLGKIHRPFRSVALAGGKGINAARAIQNLGGEAHLLTIVGGHAGRWIADALEAEEIKATLVWDAQETRTAVSVADASRRGSGLTEFYETGSPVAGASWDRLIGDAGQVLLNAGLLCLSGGLNAGAPADGYAQLISMARERSIPVAIDSHGEPLSEALGAGPDLVKVNSAEAARAINADVPATDPLQWATRAAGVLWELAGGHGAAIVTCGRDGMALAAGKRDSWAGSLDVAGSYPVGSGDAVLAAFAVAMSRHMKWPQALRFALAAGAANAELPGAGVLDSERVAELVDRAAVEHVQTTHVD